MPCPQFRTVSHCVTKGPDISAHAHCFVTQSLPCNCRPTAQPLCVHCQVRHYAKKELSGYIRISVGKPEHTDVVIAALKAMA
jgi:hypothetical protein